MSSRSANGGGRGDAAVTVDKEEIAKFVQEAAKGPEEQVASGESRTESQPPSKSQDTTPTKSTTVTRHLNMRSERSNPMKPSRDRASAHTGTPESPSATRPSNQSHESSAAESIRHHPNSKDTPTRARSRGAIFLRGYPNVHGHRQDDNAYGRLSRPRETRDNKVSPLTLPDSGQDRAHGSPVGVRGRGVAFRGLFSSWIGSDWRRRRATPVDTTTESVQDGSSDISQSDPLEPLYTLVQGTVVGTQQEEVRTQIVVIQGEEKTDEKKGWSQESQQLGIEEGKEEVLKEADNPEKEDVEALPEAAKAEEQEAEKQNTLSKKLLEQSDEVKQHRVGMELVIHNPREKLMLSTTPTPPQSPILEHRALSGAPPGADQYGGQQKHGLGSPEHRQTNIPTEFEFDDQGRLRPPLGRLEENSIQPDQVPEEKKRENLLTNGEHPTISVTPPAEELANKLKAPPTLTLSPTHEPGGVDSQQSTEKASSRQRRAAAVAQYLDFDEYGCMSPPRQLSPERLKLPDPAEAPPVVEPTAEETTQENDVMEPNPQSLFDAGLHIHVNERYQEVVGHMTMTVAFGVPMRVGNNVEAFEKLAYQMVSEKLKKLAESIGTEEMPVDWSFESETGSCLFQNRDV